MRRREVAWSFLSVSILKLAWGAAEHWDNRLVMELGEVLNQIMSCAHSTHPPPCPRALTGIFIGLNMALISIATEWASDLKQGYCANGWWLNQKFCCWEMMDPAGPGGAPVPPASVKAAAASAALLPSISSNSSSTAVRGLLTLGGAASAAILRRADEKAGMGGDLSETCTDWVPWSHWTVVAWIAYVAFAVSLMRSTHSRQS